MAESDEADDYLSTSVGGVICRAGGVAVGQPETPCGDSIDNRVHVEDKLNIAQLPPSRRQEIFKMGPWKNYFLVELYRKKSGLNNLIERGTAFLTNLVREEPDGTKYAAFLTAAHVLFDKDRVVLKHSSELLKGGLTLESVAPFIDLRQPHIKNKGWFDVCSKFKNLKKDSTGPNDYGVIFVKKALLEMLMEHHDMSLDSQLINVKPSAMKSTSSPVVVAGYPLKYPDAIDCQYLVSGEGTYLPRSLLPPRFIKSKASGKSVKLSDVDVHLADTSAGMSGSPVVLGGFPVDSAAEAVAIHVGGFRIDKSLCEWLDNAPADVKNGLGLNFAVPITFTLLDEFGLKY